MAPRCSSPSVVGGVTPEAAAASLQSASVTQRAFTQSFTLVQQTSSNVSNQYLPPRVRSPPENVRLAMLPCHDTPLVILQQDRNKIAEKTLLAPTGGAALQKGTQSVGHILAYLHNWLNWFSHAIG